jgi:hypothetical protein
LKLPINRHDCLLFAGKLESHLSEEFYNSAIRNSQSAIIIL